MRDYFINIDMAGARGVVTKVRLDPTIESGSEMAIDFVRLCEATAPDVQPPPAPEPEPLVMTFVSIAAEDGYIRESTANSGLGGTIDSTATTFRMGDDASNRAYRPILSFDTSSLPDNAIVVEATIGITRVGAVTGEIPIGVATSQYGDILVDYATGGFGNSPALEASDWGTTPHSRGGKQVRVASLQRRNDHLQSPRGR